MWCYESFILYVFCRSDVTYPTCFQGCVTVGCHCHGSVKASCVCRGSVKCDIMVV